MLEDLCEPAISIKLNRSEDGDDSEHHSSHSKDKPFKVKCFSCYSTNNPYCKQCRGSETVSSNHPLSLLLNEVLNRKMNMGTRGQQKRVYPIKEEQQPDQKRFGCECQQRDCNCSKTLINNSLINFRVLQIDRMCHSCSSKIENCYSLCKTCQKDHVKFWVCDTCSDNHSFTHPESHVLEPVIDFEDEKIETVSQEIQQEEEWREEQRFDGQLLQQPLSLQKRNSSIANYLQESAVIAFNEGLAKPQEPSCVKFQLDGLFSAFDIDGTKKDVESNKIIPKKQSPTSLCIPRSSKQNLGSETGYSFLDYKCDYCDMQPILDVRFHCNICEDYDLCEKCYEQCDSLHQHSDFQKIDLRFNRQKAMQRLFQKKDTNLKTTIAFTPPERKIKRNKTLHFNQ